MEKKEILELFRTVKTGDKVRLKYWRLFGGSKEYEGRVVKLLMEFGPSRYATASGEGENFAELMESVFDALEDHFSLRVNTKGEEYSFKDFKLQNIEEMKIINTPQEIY